MIDVVATSPPPPGKCRSISTTSGREGLGDLDGFLGGRRLADDLDVVDPAEEGTQALPEDHVVVDYHHADRRHGSTGIRARSQVPPSGAAPRAKIPPRAWTRLRIEVMPIPLTYG